MYYSSVSSYRTGLFRNLIVSIKARISNPSIFELNSPDVISLKGSKSTSKSVMHKHLGKSFINMVAIMQYITVYHKYTVAVV